MKIILATLALAAFLGNTYGDIKPQKNFDLNRFAGTWYRIGLAYDAPSFAKQRSKLTITMGIVEPDETGNATMTVWTAKSAACVSKVYQYAKTAMPGVFTYYSTRHKTVKDITVVETNYMEYALLFKFKNFNREYSQVSLYGRAQKLRPELLEKFKNYAMRRGFPESSIVIPPAPAINCPAARP